MSHTASSSSVASAKRSILSLGLPPKTQRLTLNFPSDVQTPTPSSLLATPTSVPSVLRRSRQVGSGATFSYVDPLPTSFPYAFAEKEVEEVEAELAREEEVGNAKPRTAAERQMLRVEYLLRRYAPRKPESDGASVDGGAADAVDTLQPHLGPARTKPDFPSARLLAISQKAIDDCLPSLDVGDSFEWIKERSGRTGSDMFSSGPAAAAAAASSSSASAAREQLSDVLAGRLVGAIFPSGEPTQLEPPKADETPVEKWERREAERQARFERGGYAPWSNAYAGHQFMQFAGQLGDGRAITLFETQEPTRFEVQLKGAGRTPYSRFADGLATIGSSAREFLCSEYMAALGIPTSRALALVSLPEVVVQRERLHTAGICTRMARSWIRIGSFQLQAARGEWDSIRALGEWVARISYGWDLSDGKPWAQRLLEECARRNATTFAKWQVLGFLHGVLNTDNISMTGDTIDYGPYGFMDVTDLSASSNHSDSEGRYIYRLQPSAGLYAIEHLIFSLSPLIAFEAEHGRAAKPGELVHATEKQLETWSDQGEELARESTKTLFMETLDEVWLEGWRARLGLEKGSEKDEAELINPLLDVLEGVDFHGTLRALARFPRRLKEAASSSASLDSTISTFSASWIDESRIAEYERDTRRTARIAWLTKYAERLTSEGRDGEEVQRAMEAKNPRFVLRNWITDELVQRLESPNGPDTDFLERVLKMAQSPFEEWGMATVGEPEFASEALRLTQMGKVLAHNLPSCSS